MSHRAATRLAWIAWLLVVLVAAAMLFIRFLNERATVWVAALTMLAYLAFATVGALVVSRRPQNAIGWVFVAGAVLGAAGETALEYAVYALVTAPGTVPGGAGAAWLGDWMRSVAFSLIMYYVLLLFPDGRLPSRRWRPVAWLPVVGLAVYAASAVFATAPNDLRLQSLTVQNPIGISPNPAISNGLGGVWFLLAVANLVLSAAAAIIRFRRAHGDERQQIKWFAYAGALALGLILIAFGMAALNVNNDALSTLLFTVAIGGIPVATGIAILKYRLYAIDRLIQRTLVYGLLTVLLALVYFGSVVALQNVFTALTGEGRSELVTVLSTLAIAALFGPLRNRVQGFIDRRFYRRRYDAALALAAFSAAARNEVELSQLRQHLLGVVQDTLQPESVGLVLLKEES